MSDDWRIPKRAADCAACGRGFSDDQAVISALAVGEGEEGPVLERADTCEACHADRSPEPALWWRGQWSTEARKGPVLDLEAVTAAFHGLEDGSEQADLRALLALILLRKRALRLVEIRGDVLVVARPRKRERITLTVPDLTPEKLDELRSRLGEVVEDPTS